jgi:hypothetical protein
MRAGVNAKGRPRRYQGRYAYVSSEFWCDPDVRTLTRDARHLLLCLMTGSLANQAGIFAFNPEAIARDFSTRGDELIRADLEALLGELEKRPSPSRSFIVRDHDALWIRNQLHNDPSKRSENALKGIRWDLSRVPRTSRVVKQYRRYYAYILEEGAHQGAAQGARQEARLVPENPSGERRTLPETLPIPETGSREKSREPRQPTPSSPEGLASAGSGIVGGLGSANGNGTEPRREGETEEQRQVRLDERRRTMLSDYRMREGLT